MRIKTALADERVAGYSSKNDQYAPASGGADGSLLLSDEEIARDTENPLQPFREYLLNKYNSYKDQNVSAADFVQAAAAIGVKSCPGGPVVKTVREGESRYESDVTYTGIGRGPQGYLKCIA